MPIRFILMVNKQGQTRLAQYYETMTIREKSTLESEMIRKCLARGEDQVRTIHNHHSHKGFMQWLSSEAAVLVDVV